MLNRRELFGAIAAAAAGASWDPERALWTPGRKLISIPRPRPPFVEFPIANEIFRVYVDDILTFGDDRRRYIVTAVHRQGPTFSIRPIDPPTPRRGRRVTL